MVYELQKAGFWKRMAAWLFDGILTGILAVGIAFLLSAAVGYDTHSDILEQGYARYEQEYGISFNITQEEYDALPEEDRQAYDTAREEILADGALLDAYAMVINLTMMITSLSILLAVTAAEFAVPMFLKNGQTLGKKIFGLCVIRTDCVRMKPVQLFVRTVLGKCAVETMIPVYLLLMLYLNITDMSGPLMLFLLLLAVVLVPLISPRKAALHDLLAGTAVAELNGQMIFESSQELLEFQKKVHAQSAAGQKS